jgi:hypothetical protein
MESVSFRDVFCDVSFRASSIVKILQIISRGICFGEKR